MAYGFDLPRPCRGFELCFIPDHRWLAPPANFLTSLWDLDLQDQSARRVRWPELTAIAVKKIVTALLPSCGEKPDTNYTNCHDCWRSEILSCSPRRSRAKAGRFVSIRERSRWDRRHRRQSRDGKRQASREASEFQIRVSVPQKNEEKACHSFTHPVNPWHQKKVLTRL
jgi:hypothetical protein